MSSSYDAKPWYAKNKKKKRTLVHVKTNNNKFIERLLSNIQKTTQVLNLFKYSFLSIILTFVAAKFLFEAFNPNISGINKILFLFLTFGFVFGIVFLTLIQIGAVCAFFTENTKHINKYKLGYSYITSKIEKSKPQTNKFASEMILKQFVQQVRLYSLEKNYLQHKELQQVQEKNPNLQPCTTSTLIERRWRDVQDTLDEFDIFLSQNFQEKIESLIATFVSRTQDVSQIFRKTGEMFESVWNQKGINIEHAIVVPLKAHINEKLLKRLLVGPWRASVYFSPKGGTVTFSAKNEDNKIVARWACLGITFAPEFYNIVCNTDISANTRIEIGMTYISNQPQNSNMLFGLISLIIWNDLASAVKAKFEVKQGNDGMIIALSV